VVLAVELEIDSLLIFVHHFEEFLVYNLCGNLLQCRDELVNGVKLVILLLDLVPILDDLLS